MPPATPARPGSPAAGLGAPASALPWGRGGVLQPPLYQCVGVWRRSGKPHPRTPNPAPTPPPRRLPEGPGAWLMAHPGLLGRWGCRGHQGSGRPSPHTGSAAGIPHLIPDLGVRTGSQKPWVLSPDLLPGIREKLPRGVGLAAGVHGPGQATAPCLRPPLPSPPASLTADQRAFFFF